jgi:phospholipid transport system substrate-binding protein
MSVRNSFAAAAIGLAAICAPAFTAPAVAQAGDAGAFVQNLAVTGLGALRGDRAAARGKFRSLLARDFAVDAIGDRLIRRWRPKLTPAQYSQYQAAFPSFIIGTYADRLYDYADASVKVIRVQNQGANAAVLTQVTRKGGSPINAVWSLTRVGGSYKVTNITVGGVNMALAQAADFDSYIQRNGFDALIAFMKKRG